MAFDRTFKVASFNCYNLVRPGVTYYNRNAYSQTEFDNKVEWSADLISRTAADLIGFQEVFHKEALEEIVSRVPHLNGATVEAPGATRAENEGPDPDNPGKTKARMPKVALATKLPVLSAEAVVDFPAGADLRFPKLDPATGDETLVQLPLTQFQRPILKARLELSNGVLATVFVAHLKSKRPSVLDDHGENDENPLHSALGSIRSLVIRAAEAAALRALVLEVVDDPEPNDARGEPVIVIGDLNDNEKAVSTKIVGGRRPWMFAPFDEKRRVWDTLLYNTHDLQAEQSLSGQGYTHIFDGHYESLDHILISQEFHRLFRKGVGEFRNLRLYNDHLVDGAQSDDRHGRVVIDHGVPVAEIKLKSEEELDDQP